MAKIRVYELARDLNIESKLLVNTLKSVGVVVSSHQSTLSDDDVDRVKRAIKGEAVAAKPGAPVAAKSSQVVIRRRRPGVEPPPGGSPEAAAAPAPEGNASVPETAVASEKVVENLAEEKAAQMEAPPAVEAQPEAEVRVSEEPPPEERPGLASRLAGKFRRKMESAGATIVRKATPQEVEQSKQERENLQAKRRSSKEDSRGTKFTGIGTQENAAARSSSTTAEPVAPAPDREASKGVTARRFTKGKKRGDEEVETEEEEVRRPVVVKGKKDDHVNMRTLLSEIELREQEELAVEIEEPVDVPVAVKTVYTPSAGQRRRDLKRRKDLKKPEITTARAAYRVVEMGGDIQVGEFARQLKIKATEIIEKLMKQGVMVSINEKIDFDTATLLANEYKFEVKSNLRTFEDVVRGNRAAGESEERPPIVTVMGHVDHGKTSILDAIRKTDVVTGEAGGITQHIGAYSVTHNGKKIAFLDTPGHEAFSAMRARGATCTDIVVLVVAADDGVMPQTVEAISHAKDAGVPIIVALNKIDKEVKNLDRVFSELSEHGIQTEEWGGDTQCVKVSALKKIGIDQLLEAIVLQAEVLELTASEAAPGEGVVVEAHLDTGRGPIATVMVRDGTLRVGDFILAGSLMGRVRALYDHHGEQVEKAGPSTPVEVLGLSGVPLAGDAVHAVADEKTAREGLAWRQQRLALKDGTSGVQSLEQLLGKMKASETPELPLIVKGDAQGSVEAIVDSLTKLNSERVRNKIIHKSVGGISESDIALSEASGAPIIGFNVRAARGLDDEADKRGVVIKYFSIIYELVDAVKALMEGKLPPILEEVVVGRAEVRQPISVPKMGTIAGSAVTDGKITRSSNLRLIRDAIVIYNGKVGSLRRFKDDVKEVKSGYECGIGFEGYNDIRIGDVIEAYEIKETRPTL